MPSIIFRPIPEYYRWGFMVSPLYGVVCLGNIINDQITDIRATIERLPDGSWAWHLLDTPYHGNEPSQNFSIAAVKKIIDYITSSP